MEHECSVIALAGTPKAGKTTIFNGLTGMCRYTGSWWGDRGTPGRGTYTYCGQTYMLLDMPGAYSLPPAPFPDSGSRENRDSFLGSQQPDVIAVVADATRLELGLHLLKQVLGMDTGTRDADNIPVILCVNFCDEALRTGLVIDYNLLEDVLQIPVIPCCARRRSHLDDIKAAIHYAAKPGNRKAFCYDCLDFSPKKLAAECICASSDTDGARRVLLDLLLTGPVTGKIILLFLLAGVLHLTMIAAGFPSQLLWEALSRLELSLDRAMTYLGAAPWLTGCLVHGGFSALSWTAAIMLPPLAVFLFFFTLLEDLGFLPRASMGMDPVFGKCGACGGQCVTMALGLGCNAAGVACCRSIQSPKERTIAVLTNSMIPCCGRFPVFIMLIPLFFAAGPVDSLTGSLSCALLFSILLLAAVYLSMGISWLLSKTLLKGLPSAFTLELPPYRKMHITRSALRSLLNRTMVFTGRAVRAAVPAGIIVWFLANLFYTGPSAGLVSFHRPAADVPSLLNAFTGMLNPAAVLLGMDGAILAAFILSFPAGELFLPILIMAYLEGGPLGGILGGSLDAGGSAFSLYQLLVSQGWTWITAICTLVFTFLHWPCLTTCQAVARETDSLKWAGTAICIATIPGILICMGIALYGHMVLGI